MKTTKKETQEVEVVEDVLCNKCGESCRKSINYNGLINAKVQGAFDSVELEDFTMYEFDICEKCLKEFFDSFKIKVEESGYSLAL